MKQLLKSSLAVLLVVIMCFSCVLPAFAAENQPNAQATACTKLNKDGNHTRETCNLTVKDAKDVVPSQCGEYGYNVYVCPECGELFADDFYYKEGNHSYEETGAYKAPTCTEEGKEKEETCENCGRKNPNADGSVIKPLDHDWKLEKTTGDCMTGGIAYYECTRCDATREAPVAGTGEGHKWEQIPEITKEPVCGTKDGEAVFECTVEGCEATKKVVIKAAHNALNLTHHDAVAKTCTTDGSIEYWGCGSCGAKYLDADGKNEVKDVTIKAPGHTVPKDANGQEVATVVEPTCTKAGSKTYICAVCGDKVVEELKAPGHNFGSKKPEDAVINKAPTCTEFGVLVWACLVCGEHDDTKLTLPTGHTAWDNKDSKNVDKVDPTCESDGKVTWNCGVCGEYLEEKLNKTGHDYKTVTVPKSCVKYAYTYEYCANDCDKYAPVSTYTVGGVEYDVTVEGNAVCLNTAEGKFFVDVAGGVDTTDSHILAAEYRVVTNPTCTEKGQEVFFCPDCRKHIARDMNPLGHDLVVDETKGNKGVIAPTCTEKGYTAKKCTRCTYTEKANEVPAKSHAWDIANRVKTEATCISKGYFTETCKNCGATQKVDEFNFAEKKEYTVEEVAVAHPNAAILDTYLPGNCIIKGLYRYLCPDCGKYILVIIPGTGDGHKTPDGYKVTEPDCTNTGLKPAFTCSICNNDVPEEVIPALGHKPGAEATCAAPQICTVCKVELKAALPHTLKDVPEKVATCVADGYTAHKACENCTYIEGKQDLPKENHKYIGITNSRDVTCELFGFVHYLCPTCKGDENGDGVFGDVNAEYIVNYVKEVNHNWVVDADKSVAVGCVTDGKTVYKCTNTCHDVNVTKSEPIKAEGHKNAAGETIVDNCLDKVTDRKCVKCETEIDKSHPKFEEVLVEATCFEYGYKLVYCPDCKWNVINNDDIDAEYAELKDHKWGEWTVVKDKAPTFTTKGEEERFCSVCEKRETRECSMVGVEFKLDIDNAVVSGAGYADSSLVAVKVYLDSAKVDVWGLQFNLVYDDTVLNFVDAKFVSDVFTTSAKVNDNGGKVSVIANVPNYTDANNNSWTQNTTIEGKHDLVIIYFRINNASATQTSFSIADNLVINNGEDGKNTVASAGYGGNISIKMFMDINEDGDVTVADALVVYKILTGEINESYDVTVDVNKDGEVDSVDFVAIYEFIVGIKSYKEMVELTA